MRKVKSECLLNIGLYKEYIVIADIERYMILNSKNQERVLDLIDLHECFVLQEMTKEYNNIIIRYEDVLMIYNYKTKSLSISVYGEMVEVYLMAHTYLFYGICEFLKCHKGVILTGMNI